MSSCAMSVMSVLLSTAKENATKSLPLLFNCVFKSVSQTQAYSSKHLFFVWTQDIAHFPHAALQKLSVNGWADLVKYVWCQIPLQLFYLLSLLVYIQVFKCPHGVLMYSSFCFQMISSCGLNNIQMAVTFISGQMCWLLTVLFIHL